MTSAPIEPASSGADRIVFTGASANRLVGDVHGTGERPVLLLHGGGQTRHSWRRTAESLGATGWTAYSVDQRGHGDSDWVVGEDRYAFRQFAEDAALMAQTIADRSGSAPAVIGASLGGIAALIAEGGPDRARRSPVFSALVLVDITPRVNVEGVSRIHGFMRAHAEEGFATIAEAADAVAEYLPHRPRPDSFEGLKKNLRLSPDGRWRWHWDPAFMSGARASTERRLALEALLADAARNVRIPTLLVRGRSSELVEEAHVREFLDLVPHAQYVDIAGARHMVAGDNNDQFATAIMSFLEQLPPAR